MVLYFRHRLFLRFQDINGRFYIKHDYYNNNKVNDSQNITNYNIGNYDEICISKNKQIYVKFIVNFKNIKYNKDINIHKMSRENFNPKWDIMYKKRTDDKTIIRQKGAHKCPKCKSWFTTHTESQTRSADESMSIFVACSDCGFRFKYS